MIACPIQDEFDLAESMYADEIAEIRREKRRKRMLNIIILGTISAIEVVAVLVAVEDSI